MPPADRSARPLSAACVAAVTRRSSPRRHSPHRGGIESRQILANRTRCLLRLRPGYRLVARHPLLLVHVRLDQARIDRKRFAADQSRPRCTSPPPLEYPPQSIALAEALVPGTAEHRMIGDLVLDAELAKPPIGQIDLHLGARSVAPSGWQTRNRQSASGSSAPDRSRAGRVRVVGASSLCTQPRSSTASICRTK